MHRRVLVVEDDPDMLGLLVELLRGDGYEVDTASEGAEALAKLRAREPDVLVVDLVMPGMDGLALIRACRVGGQWADLPIVVLSGYPLLGAARRLGVEVCLPKPFDPHAFLGAVEQLVEQRRGPQPLAWRVDA